MSDDGSAGFLNLVAGIVSIAVGIAVFVLSLQLLAAVFGGTLIAITGSAPLLLQPLGGWLAHLIATILEIGTTVIMAVTTLFVVWLTLTGQLDETIEAAFDDGGSSDTTSSATARTPRKSSTRDEASQERRTSSASTSSGTNREGNNEFDDYAQIQE